MKICIPIYDSYDILFDLKGTLLNRLLAKKDMMVATVSPTGDKIVFTPISGDLELYINITDQMLHKLLIN